MARLLFVVTTGPENPTRVTLAFLIARSALQQGHEVDVFLGGDAVGLLRDDTLDAVHGVGTGSLRETYQALADGGARFHLSRMSSRARALTEADLEGKPATLITPDDVVRLTLDAERVLSF
jgi:predicted peroxiredoxin